MEGTKISQTEIAVGQVIQKKKIITYVIYFIRASQNITKCGQDGWGRGVSAPKFSCLFLGWMSCGLN